jgi:predicted Zn-dependent protease
MICRRIAAVLLAALFLTGGASASDLATHSRIPDDQRGVAQSAAGDFSAGRYDAAAAKFQSIIDKYPDCLYAWSNLGAVRLQQEHYGDACRALQHAVRLSPSDALIQTDLGMCYFEQQKYSAAIPPLERAEKLNPGNSNIHACLARCYEKADRHDDAKKERQTENLQQMDTFR